MVSDLIYKEECYKIVGLCMKVHTRLGTGFSEMIYKDALEVELKKDRSIYYEREKSFHIVYEGTVLPRKFNIDFYILDCMMVEVKAVSQIPVDAFKQTLNYLKASRIQLGILINFGADRLEFRRIVCTY